MVAPALTSHVAGRLRDESAVLKERRKAAEARSSASRPSAGRPAAKGKGQQPPGTAAAAI